MEQNEDDNVLEDMGSKEQCHNTGSDTQERLAVAENEVDHGNDKESHLADDSNHSEGNEAQMLDRN